MRYIYILFAMLYLFITPVFAYEPKFHTWDINSSNHTIGSTIMFDDENIKIFYEKGQVFLQNGSSENVYFKFGVRSFNGIIFQTYMPNAYRIDDYTDYNIVEPGLQGVWNISPILDQSVYNAYTSRFLHQYQTSLDAATLFYTLKVGNSDAHLNSHTFVDNAYNEEHFKPFTEHKLVDLSEEGFDGSVYQLQEENAYTLLILNRSDSPFLCTTTWYVNQEKAAFYTNNNEFFQLYPYTAQIITFPYNTDTLKKMNILKPNVTCKISLDKMTDEFESEEESLEFEIVPREWLAEKSKNF